jgi:hypothetical protein
MDSVADEFNLLARDSVEIKYYSTHILIRLIPEYLSNMCSARVHMTCQTL